MTEPRQMTEAQRIIETSVKAIRNVVIEEITRAGGLDGESAQGAINIVDALEYLIGGALLDLHHIACAIKALADRRVE